MITAEKQRAHDRHITEVKGIIADCQEGLRNAKYESSRRSFQGWMAQRTEQLATMGTTAQPAKKGEWRPAARQTEKAGV